MKIEDKQYINKIKKAIENEEYDDFEEDTWETIENLIRIIESSGIYLSKDCSVQTLQEEIERMK